MYKPININIFKSIYKFFNFIVVFFALFFLSTINLTYAQSASTIDFTISADKTSVQASDIFNISYTLTNKSKTDTIFNASIKPNFMDKLDGVTFLGSSTGFTIDKLKTAGYTFPNLGPEKSITIIFNFSTNADIISGKKITNLVTGTSIISTILTAKYSTDPVAPTFTKEASLTLPDVAKAKPEISLLKYPAGVTGFDLTLITTENISSVSNVYFESDNAKITFTEPLDLSTPDALNLFKNFNQFVDINVNGYININENKVLKKAKVELKNINYSEIPIIIFNTTKYDKQVTYDKTTKIASFEISTFGKYTAVSSVKTDLPDNIQAKSYTLHGIISDPSAKFDVVYNGQKHTNVIHDISTGNFTLNLEFDDYGQKDIEFIVYAKNGVINSQIVKLNVLNPQETLPTSTPSPTYVVKDEKSFLNLFVFLIFGIIGIGILGVIAMVFLTFYRNRKKKGLISPDKNVLANNDMDIVVTNLNKTETDKGGISENRHELIRAKVENRLTNNLKKPENESMLDSDE
ncbi:MAG: hypothetical protein WCJ19_05570 [bacterium]